MNPTRILIADDHPVIRDGLPGLIMARGREWEICGAAADAEAAIAKAGELQPDIVIMDYKMGVVDGLTAASQVKERVMSAEVLIFSEVITPLTVLEIYRSPVSGYMLKSEGLEELMCALETLRDHYRFRSRRVTELYHQIMESDAAINRLSGRELETLRLIVQGKLSKEIAGKMGVGLKTVDSHRTHLFRKFQCKSATELIQYVLRHGLVDLSFYDEGSNSESPRPE